MKNVRKLILGVLALCAAETMQAQDVHFSQFYETPLFRNPALAGIVNGDYRVQAVYRSQWNSVANAYKTISANAEYKIKVGGGDNYATLGMQVFHDEAGSSNMQTLHLLPAINFHKSLSSERNMYLSAGFMGGVVQRRFDRSKITTNNTYDNGTDGEPLAANGYRYFDGSAGLSLNGGFGQNEDNSFVLGVGMHHLTRPKNSFFQSSAIEVAPKYVLSGALKLGMAENTNLIVHSDVVVQDKSQYLIGGLLYNMKFGPDMEMPDLVFSAGTFLRWNDALIPTIKAEFKGLAFGLSYDVNISKLKSSSLGRGGFELSLTYVGFRKNVDNSSLNAMHCPRF
ncbi:PorP/SprF family type IX secretion system membrane protein [Flaviaesturariibacter aridisoli]|uniref:Type IX secretion system membrane protein PorP/SprF n=1 Tax=Flaviaesturariibacter aridisoli TaxID=2545761 RepID=A0A4R4DZV7_9BACT|nr:PorP/SprF family type IX secretion system membrane protein [Flaviaesturariibacter aridisoli]TCZ68297.1 type IX secretion system membrane protein PorP/SprF [Flaviaesturariibacter aridisoli]